MTSTETETERAELYRRVYAERFARRTEGGSES